MSMTSAEGPSRQGERLHIGFGDDGIDLLPELFDKFGGSALRRTNAIPSAGLIARHELTHGRNARQRLRARRTGYRETSDLAGFDVLLRPRYYLKDALHLSADHVRQETASILDKNKINAGHYLEQFGREVHRGPAAGRDHVDLAGIGFGIGDELGNGLGRE